MTLYTLDHANAGYIIIEMYCKGTFHSFTTPIPAMNRRFLRQFCIASFLLCSFIVFYCHESNVEVIRSIREYNSATLRNASEGPMNELRHGHMIYENQVVPYMDEFTINHICEHSVNVTIIVTSSPEYFKRRSTVRRTYGKESLRDTYNFNLYFALGKSKNEMTQAMIEDEDAKHHDIIQWDFIDSYDKLTVKTISLLNWAAMFCSKSSYILKADDDVYINVIRLHTNGFFEMRTEPSHSINGYIRHHVKPIRDPKHRFYVPYEGYKRSKFPKFAVGSGYILNQAIVGKLVDCAMTSMPLVQMEDVSLGIAANLCHIKVETNANFSHMMIKRRSIPEGMKSKELKNAVIISNHLSEETIHAINNYVIANQSFTSKMVL